MDSVISWEVSNLLPGASLPGRLYYFTMCGRDSAYNWDTLHIFYDSTHTGVDQTRPVNYANWDVSYMQASPLFRLRIDWPSGFFNNNPGLNDTVPQIGVWVSTSPIGQAIIDAGSPTFTIDAYAPPAWVDTAMLLHNTTYYVALSPLNHIGIWGAIVQNQSLINLRVIGVGNSQA
jgi:hypothetical protein